MPSAFGTLGSALASALDSALAFEALAFGTDLALASALDSALASALAFGASSLDSALAFEALDFGASALPFGSAFASALALVAVCVAAAVAFGAAAFSFALHHVTEMLKSLCQIEFVKPLPTHGIYKPLPTHEIHRRSCNSQMGMKSGGSHGFHENVRCKTKLGAQLSPALQ